MCLACGYVFIECIFCVAVYINIISTGPDLRPYNDNMLVYVEVDD